MILSINNLCIYALELIESGGFHVTLCTSNITIVPYDKERPGYVRLRSLRWSDGRAWRIDRVLHTCQSPDCSYEGIRYTVLICGQEKYLYRSEDSWYVQVE